MENINKNPLLTQQHIEWRNKVRRFAESTILPVILEIDKRAEFNKELTCKMGEIGLLGIQVEKKYGGLDLDSLSYIIAVEEIARIDGSQAATIAAHNSLGLHPIAKYGTEAQKEMYLPKLAKGNHLWAFGLTEPTAGSDARGVKTFVEETTDGFIINGEKIFITNSASDMSLGVTIQAISGSKNGKPSLSAYLVDYDTPGVEREFIKGKLLWRSADTGKIKFENCKLPSDKLLGEKGKGAHIMLETLDGGRLSIAAMGLGLAQGAYEMAKSYAMKREQFGKQLARFQSVAFKIAEMDMRIETARNTLYHACWLKQNLKPYGREAAIAKLYCSEVAKMVADEAIQIFGAVGFLAENHIERFFRDQRILQIGEGTSEILRIVIAKHIGLPVSAAD